MAYNLQQNDVPLGTAGTGAAYILPQSTAIDNIGDAIDLRNKQEAAAQAAKLKAAQELAQSWQKNRLDIKGGTLWQPEIAKASSDLIKQGSQLMAQGIDPYGISTDPNVSAKQQAYQQQYQAVKQMADARENFQTQAAQREKDINDQAPGYYDPQSIQDYHNFLNGSLADHLKNGYQMPNLQRTFDLSKELDKMPGVPIETSGVSKSGVKTKLVLPNEQAHTELANGLVNTNPQVQADIAKKAGVAYNNIPDETDPNVLKQHLDDFYRSNPQVLAKQGISSFGDANYDKMNQGVGIPSNTAGQYQNFINGQAKQLARAAQIKSDYINGIKTTLDNKVHAQNDKDWDFKYNEEMRARQRMGMETERFDKWLDDQQQDEGQFSIGNANSNVPVPYMKKDAQGQPIKNSMYTVPEKGASLFGVNLPEVKQVVSPSTITNLKTGQTSKNTSPVEMTVSAIKMVPVYRNTGGSADDSELSLRQLKESVSGKGIGLDKVTFKPFVYGLQTVKDKYGHSVPTPIKVPYDAVKGVNNKKIITTQFDQALDGLQKIQQNPKFIALPADQKLEFLKQHYQIQDQ